MTTPVTGSRRRIRFTPVASLTILVLLIAGGAGFSYWRGAEMSDKVLTDDLAVPLDGAATARIDINSDLGHLTIDRLTGGEPLLLGGTLQYFAKQGAPTRSLTTFNGQAVLEVKGGGSAQSWFRLPWAGCGGAYEWQIHLNPAVSTELKAHSNGGNVKPEPGRHVAHPRWRSTPAAATWTWLCPTRPLT